MPKSIVHTRLMELSAAFIKEQIDHLAQTDLSTAGIDRLKRKLVKLLRAYVVCPLEVSEGRSVFRARRHSESERHDFLDHVDRIYPQEKFIKRLGRANRRRQCIYYFATDEGTALSELKPKAGEIITILECKPRSFEPPILVPIGIHQMTGKYRVRIGGSYETPKSRIGSLFQNDQESLRKHKLIDCFVLREFLRVVREGREHQYKLSVAVAELLFDFETDLSDLVPNLGLIDGLAYPSIAAKKINANLAFHPKAFHRLYQPVACKVLTIDRVGKRVVAGTIVPSFIASQRKARTVQPNGRIIW